MGCRAPTLSPQMMQTNVPGVFAAGDAVTFPLAWRNNRKVNIPHWQMAHAQGMASPMARSGAGGCPGVSASPLPPLHCWPWVLVTGLVVAGSVQPYRSDRASSGQALWPTSRALLPAPRGHPIQPGKCPSPATLPPAPPVLLSLQTHILQNPSPPCSGTWGERKGM